MKDIKRIYSLDILKLLLCIIICFHHFQQVTEVRFSFINFYGGKFKFGICADLFFVISGFVCSLTYKKIKFINYIKKKYKRLFPMAFFSTLFLLIIDLILIVLQVKKYSFEEFNFVRILKDLSLTFCWFGGYDALDINNPLWYVSVLLLCYYLYWIISKLCEKFNDDNGLLFLFFVLFFLFCRYTKVETILINDCCCRGYVTFLFGCVLHRIFDCIDMKYLFKFSIAAFIIIFSLALVSFSKFFGKNDFDRWMIFVFCLFPSIIYLTIWINKYVPEFVTKIFNKSNIIYTVYCWHYPFLKVLKLLEVLLNKNSVFNGNYSILFMCAFTIAVFVLSKLINTIYDMIRFNIYANKK